MKTVLLCLLCCAVLLLGGCAATETTPPSGTPSEAASPPPMNAQIQTFLEQAQDNDLLVVLTDSTMEEFAALGTPTRTLSAPDADDNTEITLLIPLKDGLQIVVDAVEYDPASEEFNLLNTLYDFTANLGEHYALSAIQAEGAPSVRVTASYEDASVVWYCQYDGTGEAGLCVL